MIPSQRASFDMPREVAYLNCAYMGPLPRAAVEAGVAGARRKARPWELRPADFFAETEVARSLFARIVEADAEGVAIVPAASYGVATAARNVALAPGRRVVTLREQFPSNVYSWRALAADTGAEVVAVDAADLRGATAAVLEALDERTAVAALPNVLWTTGARLDLAAIGARCREVGAALVLDLTQSAGAMVTDFRAIRPDFAVAAAYKWLLGPYALGFLYVAPERRDGRPLEENWLNHAGSEDFARLVDYRDDHQPGARRFDMGERAQFATMPAGIASLEQLLAWGVAEIEATLAAKTAAIGARARAIGLAPIDDDRRGPHFLSLALPPGAPPDLLARLAAEGVHISQRGAALRITPHLYNDDADVDRLMQALGAAL
ncbi:MAG: aminotransferase class V-fold PLP-dependent enzyme [Rhodobacteraceae bacterium]|nr:MAG: aminotransferase class V-fold PLP-dependent enzyme [Paracoccaceae bacterium]